MPLTVGARLGVYQVVELIGTGGMGEVYRARDPRLNRDVALKTLPSAFALDPDRLARFQREAQVLASLNHSNIAAIYGLEESNGVQALVLELVEGPTIADRVAEGPVPLDDALSAARQIAEALEAAHERGIIHRDLKPANVKLRADGTVKVLDFGLAKAFANETETSQSAQTPTITSPALTRLGIILGTAAYMSPEQARGKPADKRSDIWAFGCVFYEMLTGQRAFEGSEVSDTLASILKRDPDWKALPAATPITIRRVLRRQPPGKNREARQLQVPCTFTRRKRLVYLNIGDGNLWILDMRRQIPSKFTTSPGLKGSPVWSLDGVTILYRTSPQNGVPGGIFEKSASGAGEEKLFYNAAVNGPSQISPDGKWLLFFANPAGESVQDIFVLPMMREKKPQAIVQSPFGDVEPQFSPDGKFVAWASTATGGYEVYVQPFPATGDRWPVSNSGGRQPMWRPDGKELFFVSEARKFYSVEVRPGPTFDYDAPKFLFDIPADVFNARNSYIPGPDGQRFLVNMSLDSTPPPIHIVRNWTAGFK